jgi:hypothetical protein
MVNNINSSSISIINSIIIKSNQIKSNQIKSNAAVLYCSAWCDFILVLYLQSSTSTRQNTIQYNQYTIQYHECSMAANTHSQEANLFTFIFKIPIWVFVFLLV